MSSVVWSSIDDVKVRADAEKEPTPAMPMRIRVVVRIRPLLDFERGHASSFLSVDPTRRSLVVSTTAGGTAAKGFAFDQVFDGSTSQQEVYEQMGFPAMLKAVMDGYHATVFAYGQTGSGKTYTMEGYEYEATALSEGTSRARVRPKTMLDSAASERVGLIPRVINHLFDLITQSMQPSTGDREFTVHCSFVQIYNEQILDLLNPSHLQPSSGGRIRGGRQSVPGLRLRWTAARKFYVENLRVLECMSPSQVLAYFQEGVRHKIMASHRLNAASSRSHCLFTLYVDSRDPNTGDGFVTQSKLTLVDLAGSERVSKTGASGVTLKESIGINKSLFVLRQVIQALSGDEDGDEFGRQTARKSGADSRVYIPYRDSKLTSLLKDSLCGNSLTIMIACLSPSDAHVDENLSTLVYAARAQRITTRPTKNADPRTALLEELRNEVASLKQQLAQAREVILSFREETALISESTQPQFESSEFLVHRKSQNLECNSAQTPRTLQQEVMDTHENQIEISKTISVATPKGPMTAAATKVVAPRATQELKLKVIDSVALVKRMYATEKRLSDLVDSQSAQIGKLEHETHVVTVENQSLREKMEILEYLVAHEKSENQGTEVNEGPEKALETDIPGYGLLSRNSGRFASSSSSPELFPAPPTHNQIQEVLRNQRSNTGKKPINSGRRKRNLMRSAQSGGVDTAKPGGNSGIKKKHRQRSADTGLLSLEELKDLLGSKKPPSAPTGRTNDNKDEIQRQSRQYHQQQRSSRDFKDQGSISSNSSQSFCGESSAGPVRPQNPSALDLDPLDSLSELSRLLRVKAALRQGNNLR